jgi:hypothetical protein
LLVIGGLTLNTPYTVMTFAPGHQFGLFSALQFGTRTGVDLGDGTTLEAFYNNSTGNIQLERVATPATTSFHWIDGADSWDNASDWSAGAVPTATSDVMIGDTTGGSVTLGHDVTVPDDHFPERAHFEQYADGRFDGRGAIGRHPQPQQRECRRRFCRFGCRQHHRSPDPLGPVNVDASGSLLLNGGEILDGTLAGAGLITTPSGQSGTLSGITISPGATFTGADSSATILVGTITNQGTIALN